MDKSEVDKLMVRFNRGKHSRTDTLVTVRLGDNILFGVTFLKHKVDKFDKALGLTIAKGRLAKALDLLTADKLKPIAADCTPTFDYQSKFGAIHKSQIKPLLEEFKSFGHRVFKR